MRETSYIEIGKTKYGLVRNPYERVIHSYRESWNWIGIMDWVEKYPPELQCELYKGMPTISLEYYHDDLPPNTPIDVKNKLKRLKKMYSDDYRRWYSQKMKSKIDPLIKKDLETYGYRF